MKLVGPGGAAAPGVVLSRWASTDGVRRLGFSALCVSAFPASSDSPPTTPSTQGADAAPMGADPVLHHRHDNDIYNNDTLPPLRLRQLATRFGNPGSDPLLLQPDPPPLRLPPRFRVEDRDWSIVQSWPAAVAGWDRAYGWPWRLEWPVHTSHYCGRVRQRLRVVWRRSAALSVSA